MEGILKIEKVEPDTISKPPSYSVIYVPNEGGGALKRQIFYGDDKVSQFLIDVSMPTSNIEKIINAIRDTGHAQIVNLEIDNRHLQKYDLGVARTTSAIRSYLEALTS